MRPEYIDGTERIGDAIVQVFADTSGAGDPRDADNLSEMVFLHRRYSLGDRQELEPDEDAALRGGGLEGLRTHLARQPEGLLALTEVGMYDHSGVTIYPVSGTDPNRGHATGDAAGWDSGVLGFAYITRKRWDELHGGDPEAPTDDKDVLGKPITVRAADAALTGEIQEYDDWLTGNVWAYRIVTPCDHADEHDSDEEIADCPHSEVIDACYGFVGDSKYAWEEARASARVEVAS